MGFVLEAVETGRLLIVEDQWRSAGGDDEFAVEVGEKFQAAHRDLSEPASTSRYLEVRDEESGETHAILDMIDARRISTTKLLSIWTSPRYWDGSQSATELKQAVIGLYSRAFIMLLDETTGSSSTVDVIKLYGRADEMFTILATLNEVWGGDLEGWSSEIQGRWLVLTRS